MGRSLALSERLHGQIVRQFRNDTVFLNINLFEDFGHSILQAKAKRDHLASYEHTAQNSAPRMVWYGMVLARMAWVACTSDWTPLMLSDTCDVCCHPKNIFIKTGLAYFSKTMPAAWLWLCVLCRSRLQFRPVAQTFGISWDKKNTTKQSKYCIRKELDNFLLS